MGRVVVSGRPCPRFSRAWRRCTVHGRVMTLGIARAPMGAYLWIGLGGALGSMARHGCGQAYLRLFGANSLWVSTVIINILGSLIIGLASSLMVGEGRFASSTTAQQFVIVG